MNDRMMKFLMWGLPIAALIMAIVSMIFVVLVVRAQAADDHRIHPECVESTDANGKAYRSCHVGDHGPDQPRNLVPVQPRTEVMPHDPGHSSRTQPAYVAPPQVVQEQPRPILPPGANSQQMPPRIFFTPGGPVVVQIPAIGTFSFQFPRW